MNVTTSTPCTECGALGRAAIAAVAGPIAARALREAADEVDLTFHAHTRREAIVGWLRARAGRQQ